MKPSRREVETDSSGRPCWRVLVCLDSGSQEVRVRTEVNGVDSIEKRGKVFWSVRR